ncbi:hypothetical protein [Brucella suis]|uniref:hypothetical protein n=1 Tax=Brucella suis TaxID=29461 RepID=UPI003F6A5F2D
MMSYFHCMFPSRMAPGDAPDFSHVKIPRAAACAGPKSMKSRKPCAIWRSASSRMLNREGEAVGHGRARLPTRTEGRLRHMMMCVL